MAGAAPFETLPIPQKSSPASFSGSYRVYKDAKEFVTVKAATALEAFEASGLKEAHRIERERLDGHAVLGSGSWKANADTKLDGSAEAAPAVASAPAAADAAPAPEKPA